MTAHNMTFDLGSGDLYLMLAKGHSYSGRPMGYHERRVVTAAPVDFFSPSVGAPHPIWMVKTHAILCIGAWLGAAPMAILYARYLKGSRVLFAPKEKNGWFVLHLSHVYVVFACTVAGFVFIAIDKVFHFIIFIQFKTRKSTCSRVSWSTHRIT